MLVYLIVNAEHPWVVLDPHSTTDNQWNSNNLGKRNANKGLRENFSIKSYNNFGWKGEQDHVVEPNLLLKTGLQNAICTILLPNELGNGCTGQVVQGMPWSYTINSDGDAATQVTRRPNPSWGQDLPTASDESSEEMQSHLQQLNNPVWIPWGTREVLVLNRRKMTNSTTGSGWIKTKADLQTDLINKMRSWAKNAEFLCRAWHPHLSKINQCCEKASQKKVLT